MMLHCKCFFLLFFPCLFFGQVGVNTTSPTSTFDVKAPVDSAGQVLATDYTGLQAPRISRAALTQKGNAFYGIDQEGALIYINDVSGGDSLGQRINITAVGYYFFDGTIWRKVAAGSSNTLYSNDDRLVSNRTVNLDGKSLQFTNVSGSQQVNQLSIDGSTMSVDALNNRVGFGVTSPTETVDVSGSLRVRNRLVDGLNSSGTNNQILSTDGTKVIWVNTPVITPVVYGNMSPYSNYYTLNGTGFYTGTFIDLPPGKWSINGQFLLNVNGLMPKDSSIWVRSSLSLNSSFYQSPVFLTNSNFFSGALTGPNDFGLASGTVIVFNTTSTNQRLYLWRLNCSVYGGASTSWGLVNFGTNYWGENYLVAYPIN